jgi:hypothetical protein
MIGVGRETLPFQSLFTLLFILQRLLSTFTADLAIPTINLGSRTRLCFA